MGLRDLFRRGGDHSDRTLTEPIGTGAEPAADVDGAGRSGVDRRRTFLDPALQAEFEQRGFVVVDLLDAEAVAAVTSSFETMDHVWQDDYEWVEGFDTSIYDPRADYRAAVLDAVEAEVGPAMARILDDHRILFANFVVKHPDSEAVPPHVDWTFVDEDRYSSVTIWCPLVDTTPENGTLGLVAGSHHRIGFLRAANIPSFERCEDAVADIDDRPVIPLRAGQAIVLDNRAVHFSPPNTSDAPRVAIGCVAAPVEAPLRHYWQDEDERLLEFELERSFYLSYVIGRPPSEADGVVGIRVAAND
jgi:hypothetical protein